MLIKCPECQREISETAHSCPHCGYQLTDQKITELKQQTTKSKNNAAKTIYGIGIGCFGGIVLLILFGLIFSPSKLSYDKKPSSYYLESFVKRLMHNPDSFEQVSTEYYKQDGYNIIKLTYRGTNSFGGVVTNWIIAKVDSEGKVLQVVQQGP